MAEMKAALHGAGRIREGRADVKRHPYAHGILLDFDERHAQRVGTGGALLRALEAGQHVSVADAGFFSL
jgi:hypothetical protein